MSGHIPLSMKRKRRLAWRHWETWASLLLCGVCAGVGGWLGQRFAHPGMGGALGGCVGGRLHRLAVTRIARRHA